MMMSWGHDFPFGFIGIPEKIRLEAVRDFGFDAVMLHWQEENGLDPCRRFDLVAKTGLQVHTVHFPQERMADMWREGDAGDRLTEEIIAALREISERKISHMVVHTTRRLETPEPNETGLKRFARAAEAAERCGVDLAVENTRFLRYNRYLFDRIDSPRLAFCYDCGHNNCFTPKEDALELFGDRLVTTHLHDNHGIRDEHMLIGEGSVDLNRVFRRLVDRGVKEFNLESRYTPIPGEEPWTLDEYLEKAIGRLKAYIAQAQNDSYAGKA